MHIHKNTKLETVIRKQKTSKTKNAQPKQTKIKATEFDLYWSSIAGLVCCLPLRVVNIFSDIPLEKTTLSFASDNNWRYLLG